MRASSKTTLLEQQRAWAGNAGLGVDERGYVSCYEENLRQPLSPRARIAFDEADGSELTNGLRRPAKMRALHSSSALAVNFFDYWSERGAAPLLSALGLHDSAEPIAFERKYSTGLEGKSPNLDVVLKLASGTTIAIESKFSEWLTPKSPKKVVFKQKYFPPDRELWTDVGLPACQSLAADIHAGREQYRFLDVPQLLKHSLGLATQLHRQFALCYLYFDVPGAESESHRNEIARFGDRVGVEIQLKAATYQGIFNQLQRTLDPIDSGYMEYLRRRYFS